MEILCCNHLDTNTIIAAKILGMAHLTAVLSCQGKKMNSFPDPTTRLSHIPQCTIQNRDLHISVLNAELWDMRHVHRGICESPVSPLHKAQCRVALMFSLVGTWINGSVNNREAGDLRRHRAQYDVTVMMINKKHSESAYTFYGAQKVEPRLLKNAGSWCR